MAGNVLRLVNSPPGLKLDSTSSLSLKASPKTDIYATPVPPELHVYSAPIAHRRIKTSSLSSTKTTVSGVWILQYDQGGLIITLPSRENPDPDASNATTWNMHPAWVKAGVEVQDGKPYISVVAKARNGWCDWSLVPTNTVNDRDSPLKITLEMTRYKNALLIWLIDGELGKVLVRKVPWVFLDDESNDDAFIGVYAARPDPDNVGSTLPDDGKLEVHFEDLQIITGNPFNDV
ncbi:hypothetical protein UCRPC4_g04044 [Phaeomoniella chlamydospora]|uniref:Uncharacterized protein n=1 Tax=Phaeomoniella chlamydospora TaxID=158046 RepID=A0A0G2ECW9_PHACM|nr:hypothetical protein UCRPC4_g04044 [Phaeomoniella chlamydospora]